MSATSSVTLPCKGINQIALAVTDLETVARNYWEILGIGPWAIYAWEAPLVYDRKYRGAPAATREKIALTQVGNVQLELVQAVDGPSIYHDWVAKHGDGLHHLNFLVDDVDVAAGTLAGAGFPSLQSGRFGPRAQRGAYDYIDIEPLRAIWEPVHLGEEIGAEPRMLPATAEASPAKIRCAGISQVAIVVEDLEQVARSYAEILGIGPWAIYDWEAPLVYDRKYRGKHAVARERIALTQVGSVQLELVQPVEGPSIYRDWLDVHGEGLHHLNFLVDDVDAVANTLAGEGFASLQSGRFGPRAQQGAYNYIDIPPLCAIWEPVHLGTEIGAEPRMVP